MCARSASRPATGGDSGFEKGDVLIRVRDIYKSYDGRPILKGISFDVRKGETLIIMGGSGHGKSTMLRLMIGAEKPDSGTIELFGKDITSLHEEQLYPIKKRFGVLFQSERGRRGIPIQSMKFLRE